MLNIGRMAPGGEDYYLATVADGVEEYYLGRGELPGRWLGSGATVLGLSGEVAAEQLRAVLGGRDPDADEPLLGQRQRKVPGFDLTFRAPKSVSLLYGLGEHDVSEEVRRAHDAAVEAALGYLEREAIWTRRGRGGAERVPTTGAVAAAFMHRTSRAGDPLLHTHVLVANLGQTADDGAWRTLDSRRLYAHAKTAGYLYQAHLRDELTRRLGVAWEPVTNGTADVRGVPRDVVEAFSQRRAEILAHMEERGESSARAAQVATLGTRQAKAEPDDPLTLRERWRRRAVDLGFAPDRIHEVLHRPDLRPVADDELAAAAEELVGPDGLTERASTFSRRDAVQAWCERLTAGMAADQVERLAGALLDEDAGAVVALDRVGGQVQTLSSRDVIRRADGTVVAAVPDDTRYSTPELLALESRTVRAAVERADAGVAMVGSDVLHQVLADRPSISDEQAEMVRQLTGSGAGVEVVVGKAGAGKTYALDAARAAWQAAGYRVTGTALAARAALELEAGAGIDSYTLDRLLADVEHPEYGGLAPGSVVVVDEAGMVGTRKLARLLDAAADADAKVVLVGDPHQLPEIEAGGLLRGLANRLPVIELTENRRQVEPWERDALDELRRGDPAAGLGAYLERGRVHVGETADDVREQLVGDWWHARTEAAIEGVMVAARRSDVDDLNTRARERMTAEGELTGPDVVAAGRSFQAGDRIVCLRNDRRLGVVNGTRGDVVAVEPGSRSLTLRRDDTSELVLLPAEYLDAGHVDHAYAITGHKAQGLTTEATWVLGSDAMYREWGYVALSRGKQSNGLYVVAGDELDPSAHETALDTSSDPVRELVADLRRSRGQHLAIDQVSTDLGHLSDGQLRVDRQRLRTRVLEAAHSRTDGERDRLEARRDDLDRQIQALSERLRASTDARPRGRRGRAEHDREIERTQAALDLARRQVTEVTARLDSLPTPTTTPLHEAADRFSEADRELGRRVAQRVQAAAFDPPTYVLDAVGPRPDTPHERRRWTESVRAIEHYRATWGVEDDRTPLGERPRDLAQRREHDAVAALLVEARQEQLRDLNGPTPVRDLPAMERA